MPTASAAELTAPPSVVSPCHAPLQLTAGSSRQLMPQQLRHITLQITCVSAGPTCNATRVRACVPRSGVCAAVRRRGSAPPGVSTREPHPEAQSDALVAAGREPVVVEKAAGKLARRPELDQALLGTRAGDQLVVTKLDRLGRSRGHLIEPARMLHATPDRPGGPRPGRVRCRRTLR